MFVSILTFQPVRAQVSATKASDRLNGLKERKLLQSQSLLKDIKFRNIGPTSLETIKKMNKDAAK